MLLEKICKELGVEVGEEWTGVGVHQNPPKYKIQDNTLWIYHRFNFKGGKYSWKEASMADYVSLIKGEIKPIWEPEIGEYYWTVDFIEEDKVYEYMWYDNETENRLLKRGLIFKTKEEAMKVANKMLEALREE